METTYFYSEKQKHCCAGLFYNNGEPEIQMDKFVNGIEYTEMTSKNNAKSNWDDAVIVLIADEAIEQKIVLRRSPPPLITV